MKIKKFTDWCNKQLTQTVLLTGLYNSLYGTNFASEALCVGGLTLRELLGKIMQTTDQVGRQGFVYLFWIWQVQFFHYLYKFLLRFGQAWIHHLFLFNSGAGLTCVIMSGVQCIVGREREDLVMYRIV